MSRGDTFPGAKATSPRNFAPSGWKKHQPGGVGETPDISESPRKKSLTTQCGW